MEVTVVNLYKFIEDFNHDTISSLGKPSSTYMAPGWELVGSGELFHFISFHFIIFIHVKSFSYKYCFSN